MDVPGAPASSTKTSRPTAASSEPPSSLLQAPGGAASVPAPRVAAVEGLMASSSCAPPHFGAYWTPQRRPSGVATAGNRPTGSLPERTATLPSSDSATKRVVVDVVRAPCTYVATPAQTRPPC